MAAFTAGILVSILLGLGKAWTCWSATGMASCFSQSTLSYDLHPSYAAWYACWAMAYWGCHAVRGAAAQWRYALPGLLIVLLWWIVILASKSGMLGAALVLGWLFLRVLRGTAARTRWAAGLVGLLMVAALAIFQGQVVGQRLNAAFNALQRTAAGDRSMVTSTDSNDLRMVAWSCSVDRLRAEPMGAGTGDIKHALMACYHAKGAEQAALRNLNSHSQLLQGAVALGWPGLLLTLLLALVPLAAAWRNGQVLQAVFVGLFMVNAAVESVLEVQAGVIFFGLFLGLLAAGDDLRPEAAHTPSSP